ncbi:MAG: L-threonylcarbamoyladenylate synthase [Bacteroidales bacterium]|nr:L-threonylcarbamoyladenylate synthase [Bacteroidales bacterium]
MTQHLDIEVEKSIQVLKKGGVVLYPTDTIWGIGCDATNSKAVEKIYRIKHRAQQQSFIILLDEAAKLKDYVTHVPSIAYDLIAQYVRPLTIVYPKAKNIAKNVMASDGSIAIRIVNELFCKTLLHRFGKPIVSTSANISGEAHPISFPVISESIKNGVDYAVDWERNVVREVHPSTIIRLFDNGTFDVVRS